jgi:hypothetical protein
LKSSALLKSLVKLKNLQKPFSTNLCVGVVKCYEAFKLRIVVSDAQHTMSKQLCRGRHAEKGDFHSVISQNFNEVLFSAIKLLLDSL